MRFCVNYKNLNIIIKKIRYFFLLVEQLLNRLMKIQVFIKFDIRSVYNVIRIKKNEWKIAFKCQYEHYEYKIMFFYLINVFANFMNYIHETLKKYLNLFIIMYVNDILIFSLNLNKHDEYVRLILKKLRQYRMFAKLNKYDFNLKKIAFLKYIIKINEIRMNKNKIQIIIN